MAFEKGVCSKKSDNNRRTFQPVAKLFLSMGMIPMFCMTTFGNQPLWRAQQLMATIYERYGVEDSPLLRETCPYSNVYRADYLGEGSTGSPNPYSYLWPFSGTLSAVNVLFEATGDTQYLEMLADQVMPGLRQYHDDRRLPAGYASYIHVDGKEPSDRFYDDNIWIGIDFAELYLASREVSYLEMAKEIWNFVKSGEDQLLEGGVYWCEQKKTSKNTCSNAPAAVFAFRMFEATQDSTYFFDGKAWYDWTKRHLQDADDGLYWDHVNLEGNIDKRKYPYNSGQMLQSAVLLYGFTQDSSYLQEAQRIAQSGYAFFFEDFVSPEGESFRIPKPSDNWFIAVMMRGYFELYGIDGNGTYLDACKKSLDHAWNHARDSNGLFSKNWKDVEEDSHKWLLDQAAMVELYARLSFVEDEGNFLNH